MKKTALFLVFLLLVSCGVQKKVPSPESVEASSGISLGEKNQRTFEFFFETGAFAAEDLVPGADVSEFQQLISALILSGCEEIAFQKENGDEVETDIRMTDRLLQVHSIYEGGKIKKIDVLLKPLIVTPEEGEFFYEKAVTVGEDAIQGMVTYPRKVENPPLVILVSGSGSSGMDGAIGKAGNRVYRDLARGLAEEGIASLRYNDRFYEKPELAGEKITIYDEVLDDVDWIIQHASQFEGLSSSSVFVAGHSLGGMLVPSFLERNPLLKGGISLAGTPRFLEDVIYSQNEDAIELQSVTESQKKATLAQVQMMVKAVKEIDDPDKASHPFGIPASYWYSLTKESAMNRTEFKQPVLVLQGGKDFQVHPERDYAPWKEYFQGKEGVSYQLFPELNHLFMPSQGRSGLEDYQEKNQMSPEVPRRIAQWIKSL